MQHLTMGLVDVGPHRRRAAKSVALQKARSAVQSLWPRAQVKPYGSYVTGLSLPSSDLDMVICLPQVFKDSMAEAPGALEGRNAIKETWQQNLARYLRGEDWVDVSSIKIISHAAIPVIKFNTLVRGKVDFCLCAFPRRSRTDSHLSVAS